MQHLLNARISIWLMAVDRLSIHERNGGCSALRISSEIYLGAASLSLAVFHLVSFIGGSRRIYTFGDGAPSTHLFRIRLRIAA
jgi:hypothetical protein